MIFCYVILVLNKILIKLLVFISKRENYRSQYKATQDYYCKFGCIQTALWGQIFHRTSPVAASKTFRIILQCFKNYCEHFHDFLLK